MFCTFVLFIFVLFVEFVQFNLTACTDSHILFRAGLGWGLNNELGKACPEKAAGICFSWSWAGYP